MKLSTTTRLLAITIGSFLSVAGTLYASDCNGNGIDDASDLLPRNFDFLAAPSYPVERSNGLPIAADLDGDGTPDLATASGNGTVSVLLNRGDGTFRAAVSYAVGEGPQSLIAADLNGDGKTDLVTANEGCYDNEECDLIPSSVSVLLNQGDGSFRSAVSYVVGEGPQSLIAADLNGDARPDLATANEGNPPFLAGTVSVLLNQGDGTFRSAVRYFVGVSPGSLIAVDLNGDTNPDLATAVGNPTDPTSFPGAVSVLLNQGDGTFFRPPALYYVGIIPHTLIAADLNGDAIPDLVTASSTVSVLLNQGDGTFRAAVSYAAGRGPQSLIAADLNGDARPDLATANFGCLSCNPPFPSLLRPPEPRRWHVSVRRELRRWRRPTVSDRRRPQRRRERRPGHSDG